MSAARGRGWSPPARFEEYRLGPLLGRGAMGEVYAAHDELLDRAVAVKFIAAVEPDDALRQRFFSEARAIARLQHPNVVAVYRVGEVLRRPYLISELVRGQTLAALAKPVAWERALDLGIALARGLAAAHRAGVLHRDLKPANAIISEEGEVKLLDFGLAKLLDVAALEASALAERGPPSRERPVELPPLNETMPPPTVATMATPCASPPRSGAGGGRVPLSQPTHAMVGTPLYMAPEVWRGEAATRASDVYSLGVVLFELCVGAAPHAALPYEGLGRAVLEEGAPSLASALPGVDVRFAALVDRCLQREPAQRFGTGDALREALEELRARSAAGGVSALPEGNPYPGLMTFDAEHRALFFGRDAEVRAVVDRLRASALVVVTGDSGVGKSSLCRAGVLPLVEAGALGRPYDVVRFVPGRRPLARLASALAPLLSRDDGALEDALRDDPAGLARELGRAPRPILLFVDAMEELVTASDPAEAALVSDALAALCVRAPLARVLATARSDFLTRLAALAPFGDDAARTLYVLRPLGKEGLRQAIVGPLDAKGYRFESDTLVAELVDTAQRAAGGLPLLQFALAELWQARDDATRTISADALRSIGGVAGALARYADGVLAALLPAERAAARGLLGRLVHTDGTRAQKPEAELCAGGVTKDTRAALRALVAGRLVVARSGDESDVSTYELAHEALVTGWDTLRGWLSHDAEQRAAEQRLARAAAEWERLARAPAALWSGPQLREVASLSPSVGTPREREFLERSRRRLARARLLRALAVVALPLVVLGVYGGLRLQAQHELDREVEAHTARAARARAESVVKNAAVDALRTRSFSRFDARDREGGEALWLEVLSRSAEADRLLASASQSLEAALALDGSNTAVRAALADALLERALAADRDGRGALKDELVFRLAAYDERGERARRFSSPGLLSITTRPAGAALSLARYQGTDHRVLGAPTTLGPSPQDALALEPGAYTLALRAPGRAPVVYPFVLRRGEALRVDVDLPRSDRVPPGFAYVPAGRFLSGSGDDEQVRKNFLSAAPLHHVTTSAYLISRHEVTFADWLAYLRALSPAERARRAPQAKRLRTFIDLKVVEGGLYQLTMQPVSRVYTAREGEPIRYADRKRRAVQDWRRFPVVAVSFDDVTAYAGWLRDTKRVPGARLCDEHEWERAARGADDRRYPGGDALLADDANHDATYGRKPDAFGLDEVGSHPRSRSPFGLDDMAGNVWEWTRSVWKDGEPVIRGGSWYQGDISHHAANREPGEAGLRDLLIGARLCADAPAFD